MRRRSRLVALFMSCALAGVFAVACTELLGVQEAGGLAVEISETRDAASDREVRACEANLPSDPRNCGRCGHDCLGSDCVAGSCRPVAIAKVPAGLLRLFPDPRPGESLLFVGFASRPAPEYIGSRLFSWSPGREVELVADALPLASFAATEDGIVSLACAPTGIGDGRTTSAQYACDLVRRGWAAGSAPVPLGGSMKITPTWRDAPVFELRFTFPLHAYTPRFVFDADRRVFVIGKMPPPVYPDDLAAGTYELDERGVLTRVSEDTVEVVALLPGAEGFVGRKETPLRIDVARYGERACDGGRCATLLTTLHGGRTGQVASEGRLVFFDELDASVRFASVPLDGGRVTELASIRKTTPAWTEDVTFSARGTLLFSDRNRIFGAAADGSEPTLVTESPGAPQSPLEKNGALYWIASGKVWRLAL